MFELVGAVRPEPDLGVAVRLGGALQHEVPVTGKVQHRCFQFGAAWAVLIGAVAWVRREARGCGIFPDRLGRRQSAGIDQFEEEVFHERVRPLGQDHTQCFTIRGKSALGRPDRHLLGCLERVREQPADPPVFVGLPGGASSSEGGDTDTS